MEKNKSQIKTFFYIKYESLISIILPVYNGEKYLALSIESCLAQTYSNIELIIVNDCSTDATLSIASEYAKRDSRIRIINNETNKKLPASLNIGHRAARGDFLTWTSDDNLYKIEALETLLNVIVEKQIDIAYSDLISIDESGRIIREVDYVGFENIIFGNFIGASFLYRKEVYQRNNGYNENLFLVEDYDFWLRALVHSQFYQLKKKLYYYRKHEDSLTHQIKFTKEAKELWKENLKKMFANFCLLIEGKDNDEMATYLAKRLSYQNISFEWFVKNHNLITDFKHKLKQNINFSKENSIEKVFLKRTIEAMVQDKGYKTNLSNSLFIFKKYTGFIDKNDLKTMIKYSFFK